LDLPAGTVNDGLRRIEPMLQPIYEAFRARNREGGFHQADETRWLVFVLLDGKKGYGWWLWVVLGADTVVYLLAPSRGHDVPQSHFGPEASGVLEVDRYSGYKAMTQVKSGRIALAFCWTHVRRDFVGVGKSWPKLTPWALPWLRRIRQLYRLNRERLRHPLGSAKFQEQDALLRQTVEAFARSGGGRTCRSQTPPTVRQGSEELARALGGIDPLRGGSVDSHGQQRFGTRGPRPRRGAKKLLRLRFPVERTLGSDDVFAPRHAGPRKTQSSFVADVVSGKLCRSGRKGPGRHPAVSPLESFPRTARGTRRSNGSSCNRQYFLTSCSAKS